MTDLVRKTKRCYNIGHYKANKGTRKRRMTTTCLIVAEGMHEGTRYAVGQGTTVIGRGSMCDIVLLDSAVSRQHARIIKRGEHFFIYDLGSTNGTFVDNEMIEPWEGVLLKSGSVVAIGETRLVFVKLPSEEFE